MVLCRGARLKKPDMTKLPFILNMVLIALGFFILLAMSVVWIIFEEFTAFTDYTQQWIEFNFFILYWDKLTISRTYLSFMMIYGAIILLIAAFQIHGLRKRDLNVLHLAPWLLVFAATISLLGAIAWLITTAVNHNEGFLATGGFIFERMRFKGNVWKDLKFREQSFHVVTENIVPNKAPILKTWVYQRQRDFECCGWESYKDYMKGNWTELPESCCKRKYRTFQCGANYATEDITEKLNTRGCGPVMYSWYRGGFAMNIVMAIVGMLISAFEFFTYSVNRRQYYEILYDADEMERPMMNSMSLSTIHSKASSVPYGPSGGGPMRMSMGNMSTSTKQAQMPQIGYAPSNYSYNKAPLYDQASTRSSKK